MKPNYVAMVKHGIDKLLVDGIIKLVKEAMRLPPIVVVPKKNGKLKIYVDFIKLNVVTKKDPYPLHFIDEALLIQKKIVVYYLTIFLVYKLGLLIFCLDQLMVK
jgi:hypothetical protein